MSKPAKISVLLVDDHPVVRMGLRLIGDLDPGIKVVGEVATGKADKDIAQSLGLEPKTVCNYLVQVYRKLHVHSRTQAALLYQEATQKSELA